MKDKTELTIQWFMKLRLGSKILKLGVSGSRTSASDIKAKLIEILLASTGAVRELSLESNSKIN